MTCDLGPPRRVDDHRSSGSRARRSSPCSSRSSAVAAAYCRPVRRCGRCPRSHRVDGTDVARSVPDCAPTPPTEASRIDRTDLVHDREHAQSQDATLAADQAHATARNHHRRRRSARARLVAYEQRRSPRTPGASATASSWPTTSTRRRTICSRPSKAAREPVARHPCLPVVARRCPMNGTAPLDRGFDSFVTVNAHASKSRSSARSASRFDGDVEAEISPTVSTRRNDGHARRPPVDLPPTTGSVRPHAGRPGPDRRAHPRDAGSLDRRVRRRRTRC